jgi:DNA-binding XRE family transcriptional regulator
MSNGTIQKGQEQADDLRGLGEQAVRYSLSLIERLSPEALIDLSEMIRDLKGAESDDERRQVLASIGEVILRTSSVEESITLDEWIDSDSELRGAMSELSFLKRNFAELVKKLMLQHNMTQTMLAEHLEVSQPTICAIISGQHKPQPKTLERLALVFEVPVSELWPQ